MMISKFQRIDLYWQFRLCTVLINKNHSSWVRRIIYKDGMPVTWPASTIKSDCYLIRPCYGDFHWFLASWRNHRIKSESKWPDLREERWNRQVQESLRAWHRTNIPAK